MILLKTFFSLILDVRVAIALFTCSLRKDLLKIHAEIIIVRNDNLLTLIFGTFFSNHSEYIIVPFKITLIAEDKWISPFGII